MGFFRLISYFPILDICIICFGGKKILIRFYVNELRIIFYMTAHIVHTYMCILHDLHVLLTDRSIREEKHNQI